MGLSESLDKKMTALEIEKMSTLERLQTMEALWDALCHEREEIDSPDWHAEILKTRKKTIENDNAEFVSLEELKSSIRQ